MKNKIQHVASIGIAVVFLFLAAGSAICSGGKTVKVAPEMIPPDFNNFSGTFLILSQSKHWDRYVKKAFDERYTGTYLLVDKSELDDTYADLETYRYTMGRDLRVISNNSQSEVMWIYDRKDKKKYYSNRTQSFGKLQKSYAAELEKVRKK